ncbi:MAG: hypothetical protein ABSC62_13705 [Terracidiphilus sp.]|jgi:hypothetical protein
MLKLETVHLQVSNACDILHIPWRMCASERGRKIVALRTLEKLDLQVHETLENLTCRSMDLSETAGINVHRTVFEALRVELRRGPRRIESTHD